MTIPLIINGLVAAFSSNNLSTSCVLPIPDLSWNLRTILIPSSPLKLIKCMRTKPMMRPISNRNGLVRDLITLTFGAEYGSKAKYSKKI